jgi:hypothetical protein
MIIFTKWLRKKYQIKTIRNKLENLIPSIWNQKIKLKIIKTFIKWQMKKIKI